MWKCTVCQHIDLGGTTPEKCPVCDSPRDKFVAYNPAKGSYKTWKNLKNAFIGESQAYARDRAFARQAEVEDLPQIARLFRAVAAAEEIHAFNNLQLMGLVGGTQENMRTAFERENLAEGKLYPGFIAEANEENVPDVALRFSQARDADRGHGKLYEKAMQHMLAEKETTYYVCQVCGYVSDGILPDKCPVCGASQQAFKQVD